MLVLPPKPFERKKTDVSSSSISSRKGLIKSGYIIFPLLPPFDASFLSSDFTHICILPVVISPNSFNHIFTLFFCTSV